ncbi:MAG: ParB/RepB/Spo0J family partition protein [Thermovirgaceae bacterium]|nr:ParB/RepB/Spo0J family partition protein [Thermovirgaceae bacterium]
MARPRALGKGLGALIPGSGSDIEQRSEYPVEVFELAIADIRPSPNQPRKDFGQEGLEALADSIREHGVVQPVIVREVNDGYEIVAGERRWRAAGIAGLKRIPVRVIEADEHRVMELSLVENLQREDLSPLEAARGIRDLIERFALTQMQAAKKLGWSRVAITNKLRLLQLPEEVLQMLHKGDLTEGHARVLLSIDEEEECIHFARQCADRGVSVREMEETVRRSIKEPGPSPRRSTQTVLMPEPVLRVSERYGIEVRMTGRGGKIRVMLGGLSEGEAERLFEMIDRSGDQLFPGK